MKASPNNQFEPALGQDSKLGPFEFFQSLQFDFDFDSLLLEPSPCGKFIATAVNQKILLICVSTFKVVDSWDYAGTLVRCLAWEPSGLRFAFCTCRIPGKTPTKVHIVRLGQRSRKKAIGRHKEFIRSIAWSSQGFLATGSESGRIEVWETSGELIHHKMINSHKSPVSALKFLQNDDAGFVLVSGTINGGIGLHHVVSRKNKKVINSKVNSFDWDPTRKLLIVGTNKNLFLYRYSGGELLMHYEVEGVSGSGVSLSKCRNSLAVAGRGGIFVYDFTSSSGLRRPVISVSEKISTTLSATAVKFLNGFQIAAASYNGPIHVFQKSDVDLDTVSGISEPRWANRQICDQITSSWKSGDVYTAWKVIGDVCEAPWVNEVLETLDLREPLVQKRTLEEEAHWQDERAKKIRSDIEEELSRVPSVDGEPPQIKESVKILNQFLEAVDGDDPAIAWLRESTRNTVERLNEASESPLKVAILGEFSSGKSRLINALLGEKILSIGLVPVTRSVTRIVYGEEIRVTVKHLDGATVEVAADQLRTYTDERKKEDGVAEVEEVILAYPAAVLKQVEIWDTPGFNSNNQLHDQVAAQLMLEADAVLWVIAAHQVGSRSETKLLETVKSAQGKVVGVLNQIDRLENTEAIKQQKSEVWNHYGEMLKEVVPTSGKWLEENREEANRELLLDEIKKIGSWSQEQRNRKEARRVSTIACQCLAFLRLSEIERLKLEANLRTDLLDSDKRHERALKLWEEAKTHRKHVHDSTYCHKDKTWQVNCQWKTPLSTIYQTLLKGDLNQSQYLSLISCAGVLEEAHWNLANFKKVPWKEDFLFTWNNGRNAAQERVISGVFNKTSVYKKCEIRLLKKMLDHERCFLPARFHGAEFEVMSRLICDLDQHADIAKSLLSLIKGHCFSFLDQPDDFMSNAESLMRTSNGFGVFHEKIKVYSKEVEKLRQFHSDNFIQIASLLNGLKIYDEYFSFFGLTPECHQENKPSIHAYMSWDVLIRKFSAIISNKDRYSSEVERFGAQLKDFQERLNRFVEEISAIGQEEVGFLRQLGRHARFVLTNSLKFLLSTKDSLPYTSDLDLDFFRLREFKEELRKIRFNVLVTSSVKVLYLVFWKPKWVESRLCHRNSQLESDLAGLKRDNAMELHNVSRASVRLNQLESFHRELVEQRDQVWKLCSMAKSSLNDFHSDLDQLKNKLLPEIESLVSATTRRSP